MSVDANSRLAPSAFERSRSSGKAVAYDRKSGAVRGSGREIELDFIRGVAILMVLDFHAPVHWMSYPLHLLGFPNFGWAGVDVFFVLSGFLVGGLLVKEWRVKRSIDSRRFLIRRGFKIWPQYYFFLLLMLVTGHRGLHDLWGNLLNIQNYVGGIPHTWSLAVEEHAYLLLLLCMAWAARARVRVRTVAVVLISISALVVISRLWMAQHGFAVVNRTHTRIEGILYGVVLAMIYHYRPELFRRLQTWTVAWLALLVAALVYLRFQVDAPWSASLGWDAADLLGVAMLMLLYRPGSAKRRSAPYRLVTWIGVYSYGIYLWHVSVLAPTANLANHIPHPIQRAWLALAPVLAGIALGTLATKLVELPMLRLRDRLFPRRVDSPVGTPAELERSDARASSVHASAGQERPATSWEVAPSAQS